MKALYFDLIGGASGDMILGALIDAGVPANKLRTMLKSLNLTEFELQTKIVDKNGFKATKVDILVGSQPPERHLKEIQEIIQNSSLPTSIKERSLNIFQKIAGVEAGIHNKKVDQIHLHELGGTDTIVDVSGVLLALDYLEVSRIYASSIPLGSGFIKGAHGQIPLPAPATLGLIKGLPVKRTEIPFELVTPTGAALLADLVNEFGPPPEFILENVGYGAGSRDLPVPNLLRVLIGELSTNINGSKQQLVQLETNLDDLNPEIYPYVMELLFTAGALDVCLIPIQMKKNRPGTQIQVLTEDLYADKMKAILFRETTTLGIKQTLVERYAMARSIQEVNTAYGKIKVKIASDNTGFQKVAPEYEDCQILALENNLPILQVYQDALTAFQKMKK